MVRETRKRRAKGNTSTNLPKYRKIRPRPDGDESDEGRCKPSDGVSVEKPQGHKLLEKGQLMPAGWRTDDGGTESQSFGPLQIFRRPPRRAEQEEQTSDGSSPGVPEPLHRTHRCQLDASTHAHGEALSLVVGGQPSLARGTNVHSTEQEGDFLSAFQVAYALSRPSPASSRAADGLAFASLYPHFQALVANAQHSIQQCELLDHRISQVQTAELLGGLKWGEEHAEVEELLRLGQRLGRQKYEALIKGIDAPEAPSPQMERLYGPEQTVSSAAWGSVARKQMRALRKLLKATNSEG
ncbi:BgtAc-30250 [Blumeria graminis f. sp. tritici]|uniref:BgtAc-30250 n=2 Tax=Blumeria graminis f. sp. tritici TaxID=62690 RepID=A0A9X9PR55_BLUGR|nr:hypothetical protein BGT96224_Ac30250 [Blumeria graminis f. sp. tritici 96224]VCU39625.1 BgtAc-30250 [Blumeria graminis f. sp. tritici]